MQTKDTETLEPRKSIRIDIESFPLNFRAARKLFCFHYLSEALALHDGNISRTAKALGISRRNLQIKLRQLGLKLDDCRARGHSRNQIVSDIILDEP